MIVRSIKTPIFPENQNLVDFIVEQIPEIKDKSVIVVTSKIVALSEGRTAPIEKKREIIKSEADIVMDTKWCILARRQGCWCANAGVDESNVENKIVLLPQDSFASAIVLREKLMEHYGIKNLGVVITDSRTIPLRFAVVGVALGYAGIKGLRDYRGTPDIYGRPFKVSCTNVPDSIAAAAVLEMGEGAEQRPIALVEEPYVEFTNEPPERDELKVEPEDDVYRQVFEGLKPD